MESRNLQPERRAKEYPPSATLALSDVLREKYHFATEDAKKMADFLLPMLDLVPAERANAGGMSNHAFVEDAKGMENLKLDKPVGSKGDGIEGWATEVKKAR